MPLRILSSADFSGLLIAPACTTSNASIRLPHGTAPSGPADGDMWTTIGGLHVRINSVNFNLTSALSSQTANTFFAAPNGTSGTPSFRAIVGADIPITYTASLRSNVNISGGGTITVNGSGSVLWSQRFIIISNSRGSNFGTSGYFDIDCPVSGTITGVGGASDKTATAAGIPLANYEALYYILPIGSSSTSVAANFRVVSYTSNLDIPHDWVLICVRNGDNGMLYFTAGYTLALSTSINTGTYNARRANFADQLTTARNIGGVSFNGSADINLPGVNSTGNQNTTGSAATLTTARTLTIGSTGKTFNGSANVSWNLTEIGAELQAPTGIPRANLGEPTVREMALFDSEYDNKTDRYAIANIFVETSTDNVTWTDTSPTDTNKRRLIGGDQTDSTIAIPYGTNYFRIRIRNSGTYVSLNALYMYFNSQGHSTQVQIFKKHDSGSWEAVTSSSATVNSWPGHLFLPHNAIWWHPNGTLGTHVHEVYVLFIPSWNTTYPSNTIILSRLQWWGGYPAGRRNLYTTTEFGAALFPNTVSATTLTSTVSTGTAPLSVTSTTRVANLNVTTAGTADTWTTGRTITIGSTGKSVNGSADVNWSLAEIGAQAALTNPVTGTGSSGRVAFWTAASTQSSNTKLFWDNTNERLGVGTSTPTQLLDVEGNGRVKSDLTVGGIILASAAGASSASLRLPHGSAPNSPTNGDMWTTSTGLFVRINGVTVGPLGTGGGGGSGTVTSITAGTGLSGGTITTSGTIAIDQTAQIVSTRTNSTTEGQGQIYLNGTTGNRIDFVAVGVAAPATMTRSVGTKLLLWPQAQQGGGSVDYALGISTDTLWLSVADSSKMFSFYGGTTEILRLMGDGRIRGVAGSVALPTFSAGLASGDVDTGIFFPAADTIAFAEGGTEAMRITSTANVGIGTTNPEAKLDVAGAIRASGAVTTVVAAGATMSYEGNVGAYFLSVGPNATTRGTFIFNQRESDNGGTNTFLQVDNQTNIFLAQSNGNVGVGIPTASAPSSRLQVRGTGTTDSSTALRVENSAGTAALTIMDDGQLRVGAGTAGVPSISAGLNSSDTNTGIYFPGTDQMALTTGGNGRLFVSNTGVGIGLNPSMAFHCDVAGSVLIRSSNADVGINVTQALAYTHIGSDPARQSGPLYLRIDAEQVSCDPPTWQTTDFNDIYGNGGINSIILGEPDYWMEIRLGHATHSGKGGSIVLIPCYIPSNQC